MGIRDVASRALNTVTSTATRAEKAVENKVTQTAGEVAKGWSSTTNKARAELNQAATVARATVDGAVHTSTSVMGRALAAAGHDLSRGMGEAHEVLNEASTLLSKHGPVAKELKSLGDGAAKLADRAKTAAIDEAGQLATEATGLAHKALGVWDKAKALEGQVEGTAKKGVELGKKGIDKVVGAATGYINKVRAAVDYGKNIDSLGAGDSYRLGVGASASVEGIKGYGQGSIQVSKGSAGKFTVAVDGELGGGVYGELGGKAGVNASVSGAATLGIGGKLELKFDNPEDAKKATGILLKQAAAAGMSGAAGPLGVLAGQTMAPSEAEMKFLGDHASAAELKGNAAAQVSAALGFKSVLGATGFAQVKAEDGVRLEFGKPPKVTVRQELSADLSASAGAKIGKSKTDGARKQGAFGAQGTVLASATVEQSFTLPSSLDLNKLKHDPVGTVKSVASQVAKSEQDQVTFSVDASGSAATKRGGLVATASYSGNANALASSGALQQLFKGDLKGALSAAAKSSNVEVAVTPYENVGVNYQPKVSVMGFGAGVSFDATRKDVRRPPLFEYSGGDAAKNQAAFDQLGKMFEAPQN